MTVRTFLRAYHRYPVLRGAAHLLFWAGMYGFTADPDGPAPVLPRLLEWGYAAAGFYLLFYGPVRRHWERGRYGLPLAAALAVGLGSSWLLYWQNRLSWPDSAFARAYLPAFERYGVLAMFSSVRVGYYALFEGVVASLAAPAALKVAKLLFERQLARQQLEQLTRRGQLDALQQQVSPHFLFNTLNNLYGLVLHDDPRAATFTRQLGALLRYTDELAARPAVTLGAEVRFIEDYLALTRLRYDQRVTLASTWELAGAEAAQLPPLLLLPLVENAVKHGLSQAVGPAWVRLQAEVGGGYLRFSVANSVGAAGPAAAGGLGLTTLRERLRLLFPARQPLTLHAGTVSFEARLHLPLAAAAGATVYTAAGV